jgi:hypothetical protein
MRQPLVTAGYAAFGWNGEGSTDVGYSGGVMTATVDGGGGVGYVQSLFSAGLPAGKSFKLAFDYGSPADSTMYVRIQYYSSNGGYLGALIRSTDSAGGRYVTPTFTPPAGTAKVKVGLGGRSKDALPKVFGFDDVVLCVSTETTGAFDGNSGGNFYWEGDDNNSASVYHPPVTIAMLTTEHSPTNGAHISASLYARASGSMTARTGLLWRNAAGTEIGTRFYGSDEVLNTSDWLGRLEVADGTPPVGATQVDHIIYVDNVGRGDTAYFDAALLEQSTTVGGFFYGATADTATHKYDWVGPINASYSTETEFTSTPGIPDGAAVETATTTTLIHSTGTENDYSFAFWYCFTNEVGDSTFSQVTLIKTQRGWNQWYWIEPSATGGPGTVATTDPAKACDQLVAYMPEEVFDAAIESGALTWSLYMATWSDQGVVPAEGVKVAQVDLTTDPMWETHGWARVTPQSSQFDELAPIPSIQPLDNFSRPSTAAQGLVASDRMVLVHDPAFPARIQWSSNQQGLYHDFTSYKGGGLKTLTSGNMQIPASVKLWQNPQSVDTLTILNDGEDGRSSGYYMAPAEVTSQSDATPIMGFEETTATPGTASPYGCEVLNNALYHPLEDQLMKSTASNYNINHKSMTDQIERSWNGLLTKDKIISAQLDKRLYFIVNNPMGEVLEEHSNGNEIWVLDTETKAPTWSRFLIQAVSLRKIEYGDKLYMSVIREDGIYYLDPDSNTDDYIVEWDPADDPDVLPDVPELAQRYIPWRLETNTQGSNRAHDAWCRLQAALINVGNFQGTMEWGIRSWDVNGKARNPHKVTRDFNDVDLVNQLPFDLEDQLLIQRDFKEWYFYAGSVLDDDGNVLPSFGQINNLQYRYTPVTVNVGYEYGSVETFEYGRATENWTDRNTDNGVPIPAMDPRRP